MGSKEDRASHPENSVLGRMGYITPNFEDIMDGFFPEGRLTEDARIFVRGYRYIRNAKFFLVGIGAGVVGWSAIVENWVPAILFVIFGILLGALLDVGQEALKQAIETEGERYQEIIHYRELNQMVCLREFEKGKKDAGSGDPESGAEDGDLRES